MAKSTTKQTYNVYNRIDNYPDFVDAVYMKLGAPLNEINVTSEQAFIVISQAVQKYIEYDLESVAECYWLHPITADDVSNGYLTIPLDVLDVMSVSTGKYTYTNSTNTPYEYFESPQYQFMQNYWGSGSAYFSSMYGMQYSFYNGYWGAGNAFSGNKNLFYYEVTMQYLDLLEDMFSPKTEFLYRRRQHHLSFYDYQPVEGNSICLYGTKILTPETDDCIWSSDWLLDYATACVGVQYGINLMKYSGVTTIGGTMLNSQGILDYWSQVKAELEQTHKLEYQEPPLIFIE